MNRMQFLKTAALGVAMLVMPGLAGADVPGIDKAALAKLDGQVGKIMEAYNSKNWKGFYVGWADQMKALQTEQTFKTLYVDMAHKNFGAFKSKTLDESRSTFTDMNGLLVYKAQFAKKAGTLSVNFFKEGGVYKFQQVRIDP